VERNGLEIGMGQIEVAHYLVPWADAVSRHLAELEESVWEFPGVYEYEVTEEFGAWLAHNVTATISVQLKKFQELSAAFMKKGKKE
jgi:hypothetical protein